MNCPDVVQLYLVEFSKVTSVLQTVVKHDLAGNEVDYSGCPVLIVEVHRKDQTANLRCLAQKRLHRSSDRK